MARITKKQIIDEIITITDEYRVYNDKMLTLVEEGKARYGEYVVFNLYRNYHYINIFGGKLADGQEIKCRLYGNAKETFRVWDFQYHKRGLLEELGKLKELITEIESR